MAQHLMREQAIASLGERIYQQGKAGQVDSRLPLLMKYLGTREIQAKDELILELLGAEGLTMEDPSIVDGQQKTGQAMGV